MVLATCADSSPPSLPQHRRRSVTPARCKTREVGHVVCAAGNAEDGILDRGVYARRTGDHGVARNHLHK